ncbi:IQ domain-containing protein E [Elgaria multicarinata webbii]|uniref:IQ domain-containing protein E n=1 Tax=Elgaria multicarinata webbii TaxID=159646 RepID=UPI002FCD6831
MSQGPSETATERQLELAEDSHSAVTDDSDTETKLKRKTSHKPPKSPKSPYTHRTCLHSKKAAFPRSFKGAESRSCENPLVKASRQLWCGSLKQGTWMGQAKPGLDIGPALSTVTGGTPEYLKEALGTKKPKHARFSSSGYVPGTPVYKEKEDMYDEIIELKKTIQAQKCEADRMKTKLRRLEEENSRKNKQIEQLLDPSKSSELGWLRTELKNDSSMVISGLKQKILRLEQQCKEKDKTINKLQTDVKSTDVEEMRIALQTYYEEIQRLQTLLAKSKTVQRKSPPESEQQKVLNAAVRQLSRSIRELRDENQALKVDLGQALSSSPTCSKATNYTGWSSQRLVRRISELEKKMNEKQKGGLQLSETSMSPSLTPLASAQLDQTVAKESDPPEEFEHLRKLVKKLKSQRAALQNQLAVKEEEIQQLTEKVRELEENQGTICRQAGIDATEPSNQSQQEFHSSSQQSHPARVLNYGGSNLVLSPPYSSERQQKEEAARVIQRQWKAYKTKIKGVALDKVAVVLQAAFRGHLARQKLLSNNVQSRNSSDIPSAGNKNPGLSHGSSSLHVAADCTAEQEAWRLTQSVFGAHVTRTQLGGRPLISSPGSERESPAACSEEEKPVWSLFKYSPLVFTSAVPATSSQNQLQPPPSPPADEAHSDDSDDIITVLTSPVKKTSSLDFSGHLSHSLMHS